ncbi:MAG: response regulator transcription factor, partial [Pyrinomonadaceae bacterium]
MKTKMNSNARARDRESGSRSGQLRPVQNGDHQTTEGKRTRILIVEDEPAMVAGLRDNFEFEGYEVISADNGVAGLERALGDDPDLIVLDVMMPRMSGLDVCKQLKAKRPSVPIIMLTARGQEIDKVVGLELGADDYVTKPFSIRELMARVKAVLRRVSPSAEAPEVYKYSDVEVNIRSNEVLRAGT